MLTDQTLMTFEADGACGPDGIGMPARTAATRIIGAGNGGRSRRSRDASRCLAAGERVGEFEILGSLGRGGFGAVYLAKADPNRRIVLKEYFPHDIAYREPDGSIRPESPMAAIDFFDGLSEFAREAHRLGRLDHPNIPALDRFLTARGTAYFSMPYSLGETLAQELIGSGRLTQKRFEQIFPPVLDALEYVHDRGFLHRDIKPANIYVSHSNIPYLIDFGSARTAINRRCTEYGELVTHGFSPAEQYRCTSIQNQATDLYSIAATMYLAITGTIPPDGIERLTADSYVPVGRRVGRRFPRSLKAAIDAALAPRASDRPQSVAEFRTLADLG